MSRRVVVRPGAEADMDEAFRWYRKHSPGLGIDFVGAVDAAISAIEHAPELYAPQYRNARRVLLRRFPYALYYLLQTETIDVVSCVHLRQHPRRWRSRV